MNGRALGILIIVLIIIAGGWYLLSQKHAAPSQEPAAAGGSQPGAGSTTPSTGTAVKPQTIMVSYTDNGFSPATVTVNPGDTVMWTNNSSGNMWVASGVHPTHTVYDGTDRQTHCATGYTGPTPFDECSAVASGATYSFTFTKAGTWHYHNHLDASNTGTVIVNAPAAGAAAVGAAANVEVR